MNSKQKTVPGANLEALRVKDDSPKALSIIPKVDTLRTPRKKFPEPKLSSLRDIRTEIARMYRACFSRHQITPEDLSRAVYALHTLAEVIAAAEFEDRLNRLEEGQKKRLEVMNHDNKKLIPEQT
jgi:hypothetical protein